MVRIKSEARDRCQMSGKATCIIDEAPPTKWIKIFSRKLKMIVSTTNETWFELEVVVCAVTKSKSIFGPLAPHPFTPPKPMGKETFSHEQCKILLLRQVDVPSVQMDLQSYARGRSDQENFLAPHMYEPRSSAGTLCAL